ncbi:flagellar protein FlaG [Oceanobacillus massiliensis]|uniref:flagellar protein FlaG n=1 Tax=Oceanobacillus massiliensis TaxID=1465765 RepID=UPI0002893FA6|nr:flagellar protein FlaG [Oceanobacillus massiliensis]
MTVDRIVSSPQTLRNSEYSMKPAPVEESSEIRASMNGNREKGQEETTIKKEDVAAAVTKLNQFFEPIRRNLKFELHDKLDKYYVTVIDSDTKEVIKEIPPKKMLDMYAEMADFMGILIDQKI